MPIEIKELHIKIAVGENGTQPTEQNTEATGSRDEIIEACVEQVMEILSRKEER
ncbi:hypothetical protein SAMN05444285_101182 [Draconibacterium orientale]|uniref:Uncharacterized protein n=1 Tax=Draconibacterium orientale TaxID=1168034 RepID=A0A1H9YGZ4_9BACT|nr:DUF5908 family protein [Draconibacterium orientale]SES68216.1 hypothetical protein SAMN05444285_101182 [Draconibacterium orientale]